MDGFLPKSTAQMTTLGDKVDEWKVDLKTVGTCQSSMPSCPYVIMMPLTTLISALSKCRACSHTARSPWTATVCPTRFGQSSE